MIEMPEGTKSTTAIILGFNEYSQISSAYEVTPEGLGLLYPTLGLAGEAGEFVDKVKKILRDKKGNIDANDKLEMVKELGDVLWYVLSCARELGVAPSDVPLVNLAKLEDRRARGKLNGSGDKR